MPFASKAFSTSPGCLLIGPTPDGDFKLVQVKEIQFLRVTVNELCCGNSCSLKLKSLDKNYELSTNNFSKGMVLLDPETKLEPTMEFEVEALIVHHSSTIKVGYQSVVHCHVIRQTCSIVQMNKEYLMSGDSGIIRFKFMKKPEYMHVGDTILFREGRTRGKGKIIKIFPIDINSFNKDKKANKNKRQQPKGNNEQNNNPNNPKKGKKKYFKNNINNNQNQNNQNQDKNQTNSDNKNLPKKTEG